MGTVHVETARYVVAKYIPDLMRMEPRNIGVIVWSPDGVEARFMAERDSAPGDIDGRRAPRFLTSVSAYRQWISYWRGQLSRPAIEPQTSSELVPREAPEFIDALISSSRGNFILANAGVVLDPVPLGGLPDLANYLYDNLVEEEGVDEPRDATLDSICAELISTAGLDKNPHFHTRLPVDVEVNPQVVEHMEFSYGYKNGSLQRLYQRVPLAGNRTAIRKNVHDCTWMFEKVIRSHKVKKDQTAALVYVPDDQGVDPPIDQLLKVLASETRIVNVSDRGSALKELREVGSYAH